MKIILLMVLCIWICCSGYAVAQEVTPVQDGQVKLQWSQNKEPDLAGYKIHHGTTPGNYDQVIDVKDLNEYIVTGLVKGKTYYFALIAYDTSNNESGYSKEVSAIAKDKSPPGSPVNFQEVFEEINIKANTVNIIGN